MIIQPHHDPAMLVAYFASLVLGGYFIVKFCQWVMRAPVQPDPWSAEVAAEIEEADAMPLCQNCLTPHDEALHFCPECGGPVGAYTNLLPFDRQFAIGHTLRKGTDGNFRHSPFNIIGFLIFSCAAYTIFAPFYWIRFLFKLAQNRDISPPVNVGIDES